MTNLKKSIEMLNYEYRNRFSLSVVSQRASVLKLMTDSLDVRKQLENLYETLRQAPMLMEEADFDFLGWADEARWMKPEEQLFEDGDDDNWVTMIGMQQLGDLLKGEAMVKMMDLAIEENIKAVRKTLRDIHHFRKTHRWSKESYAQFYREMHAAYEQDASKTQEVNALHAQWHRNMFSCPDMNDCRQRLRELLITLFETGFLDAIRKKTYVPAADELRFIDIKDENMVDDLSDILKHMAALHKLCPLHDGMLNFDNHARLGQYIYDNNIPTQTCCDFFHIKDLIVQLQIEMAWILNPETKPKGEDETIELFVEVLKRVMVPVRSMNGRMISYLNNRHVECSYKFNFDDQQFIQVIDVLKRDHPEKIFDYLEGRKGEDAIGVTMVCPFIGCVLGLHLFNNKYVRNVDFDSVFEQVFGGKNDKGRRPSYIQKMSAPIEMREKTVFKTIKNIVADMKKQ